jgi:LysR family glycine cleavage system transcriptional activator
MNELMPQLTALRTFYRVVKAGGIAEAARALNVTPGAVRHQVRLLEAELGESLIVRNQRNITLTVAGSGFYEKLARAFEDMHRACRTISQLDVEGELRVACAPALAALRLTRIIDQFLKRFPTVNVRFFPLELADESMDVIISFGERDIAGNRYALLKNEMYFAVCSPELTYKNALRTPDDLRDHTLIHAVDEEDWDRLLRASGRQKPIPRQQIWFSDAHLSLQAAKDGCGIAIGSAILCAEDLRKGTLIKLFDLEIPAPYPYFVIQPKKADSAIGDVFCDILLRNLEG